MIAARVARIRERSPFVDALVETMAKSKVDNVRRLGAEITYYAFFAVFPLLTVFVTFVDIIFSAKASEEIVNSAVGRFPVIGTSLLSNVTTPEGRGVATVIAIATALWAGSHAFESFEHAIDVVWRGPAAPPHGMVKRRLRAFLLMVIVGTAVLVITIVGAILSRIHFLPGVDKVLTTVVTIALNFGVILLLFAAVTPGGPRWKAQFPGAIIAAIGWTLLQAVGALFVDYVVRGASDMYGVFAVVIGLLTWINIQVRFFVFAAELNSVLAEREAHQRARVDTTVGGVGPASAREGA